MLLSSTVVCPERKHTEINAHILDLYIWCIAQNVILLAKGMQIQDSTINVRGALQSNSTKTSPRPKGPYKLKFDTLSLSGILHPPYLE